MKNALTILLMSALSTLPLSLIADSTTTTTGKKIQDILASEQRSDEDRERDANRKPQQTLEYFGLQDDMTVVELFAGSGWYTRILKPLLEENGKLYLSIGTRRLPQELQEQVNIIGKIGEFKKTELPGFIFDIGSVDLEVKDVDMILTFRNLHNLSASARKVVNEAAFAALKPGGIYGVIDHTKRHMEPFAAETWRRIDPVLVIKEMLDAGFEFVAYTDMHAIAEDGLTYDTTHESINRNSDRFTFKFRKPE